MYSCCMVESQVPGQCCGLGCCPANKCLTPVTTFMFKQENGMETHLKTSEERNTMQKSSPKQCTLWFGSGPGSARCGCWCTSTSTPTHDTNIERCARRTISWCSVIGLKTSWSKHGIHQLFIKLKLRPGPTNWSKRTQFIQTKQKVWSNQPWWSWLSTTIVTFAGCWCKSKAFNCHKYWSMNLCIYSRILQILSFSHSMESHPRSCQLSSKHVGIASYPRSYYFPFWAHRRWYPLEAPGWWKQPIKQGITRNSSGGDASSQCCKM